MATVADLVDEPSHRAQVVAGSAGLSRQVQWAATCEMPNPWEWLDAGDFLLVNGYGVPQSAVEQVSFIEHLDRAAMSGLGVADHAVAPELTVELHQAADELGFPLIRIDYEVAFSSISKTVARWNQDIDQRSVRLTARVYDWVRRGSSKRLSFSEILTDIGREIGTELHVVSHDGAPLLSTSPLDQMTRDQLVTYLADKSGERVPAAMRFHQSNTEAIALPIPADRAALLVVNTSPAECDIVVLQHIATMAALHLEQDAHRRAVVSRIASDLLVQLIERTIDTGSAAAEMQILEIDPSQPLLVAVSKDHNPMRIAQILQDGGVPHMTCRRQGYSVLLVHNDDAALAALRRLGREHAVGVGAPFVGLLRLPDALAEAQWACNAQESAGLGQYGVSGDPMQPRTISEAQRIVADVLQPLIDYDSAKGADLVVTLEAFLRNNRSWQRTAAELHIHKQTLAYRTKRIEAILDSHLDDIDATSRLWYALRCYAMVREQSTSDAV
jgi:purine catabolism regulator